MGKTYFTEEQQGKLRKNTYVQKVSAKSITYTKKFKEEFEVEYRGGKLPVQILDDMVLDHLILGKRRRNSIVTRMKRCELRPEGFEDTRKNNSGRPTTRQLTDTEKIKRLEQKISYLNQENEFLKKNAQMDRQANWEYKRRHPSIQTHQKND
ncbi:HTH domain-containing protein [Clostridium estertheticum]|uniref:HTH domain-containing protein n=1 Tax=Clostridium estertheticum TaxID=238834 RepID=UPI0035CD38A7